MKDFASLLRGRAAVNAYYLLTLLVALVVVVPVYAPLNRVLDGSLLTDELLKGFDFLIIGDVFRVAYEPLVSIWGRVFMGVSIWIFLHTYFSGGIIDLMINKEFKLKRFLVQCNRYWAYTFLFFILLMILSAILLVIAIAIWLLGEIIIPEPNHRSMVLRRVPAVIFGLFSWMILVLTWVYGRVQLYIHRNKNLFRIFLRSFAGVFTTRYVWKCLALIILLSVAGMILFYGIQNRVVPGSFLGLILLIFVQQIYVYFRAFLKVYHLKLAAKYLSKDTFS